MFHGVMFDLDPAIKAQLDENYSTEVCNDDETFYDAVSTFSEGDNDDCSVAKSREFSIPFTYQHIIQLLLFSYFIYSNSRLSLPALLVFSSCVGSYFSIQLVFMSKFIQNSVVKDKNNFAYSAVT
jgi:hypothetical protein